jgi:hypothetical protein
VRRLRMVSQAIPGRPWVAVHPHYEGSPSVAGPAGTNAGESPRDHGLIPLSGHFAWSQGPKSPRWSAERRGISRLRCHTRRRSASPAGLRRVTICWCAARRSAPPGLSRRGLGGVDPRIEKRRQAPPPQQKTRTMTHGCLMVRDAASAFLTMRDVAV